MGFELILLVTGAVHLYL